MRRRRGQSWPWQSAWRPLAPHSTWPCCCATSGCPTRCACLQPALAVHWFGQLSCNASSGWRQTALVALQTGEDWEVVHSGKARGALNLDAACSGIATLEHFVIFSSMVATAGNEGEPLRWQPRRPPLAAQPAPQRAWRGAAEPPHVCAAGPGAMRRAAHGQRACKQSLLNVCEVAGRVRGLDTRAQGKPRTRTRTACATRCACSGAPPGCPRWRCSGALWTMSAMSPRSSRCARKAPHRSTCVRSGVKS